MSSFFWTLSWILMIGGGICITCSAVNRSRNEDREKYKGQATATVVDIVPDTPDRKGRAAGIHDYYYAVFAYYASGKLYKVRYSKGGNPCPFTMSQNIEIRYSLREPSHFQIYKKTQMHYIVSILYYGGLLLLVTGGVLFLLYAMRAF